MAPDVGGDALQAFTDEAREVFPKTVAAPAGQAPVATAAPGTTAEIKYLAGYTLVIDPVQCTGCMKCAQACAEHWSTELFPEQTKNTVNLEFSRIRPMRFQYVDVVNVCSYCQLMDWAEGSKQFPCEAVCPEKAIITIPEGEGKPGYYGMGYKWIDREKCLGLDKCWRCAEICEDQFGSGISFDPIEKKAQACSRCGGDPQCVSFCAAGAIRFIGPEEISMTRVGQLAQKMMAQQES